MLLRILLVASLAVAATVSGATDIECGPKVPCKHTVEKGDSLWKISQHYGVTLEEVIALNKQIEDPELIYPGDVVALPCKELPTEGASLFELLSSRADMSVLLKAALETGAGDTMKDPSVVLTLFAPTNCSFKRLLADLGVSLEDALADTQLLGAVLSYHVVLGQALQAQDLTDGQQLETMLPGQTLEVVLKGSRAFLKTSSGQVVKIKKTDMVAGKAIVHTVAEILVPDLDNPMVPVPTPAPAPARAGCFEEHKVAEGEFLYEIADEYATDVETLAVLNNIDDVNFLPPGTILQIPVAC